MNDNEVYNVAPTGPSDEFSVVRDIPEYEEVLSPARLDHILVHRYEHRGVRVNLLTRRGFDAPSQEI